MKLHRAYGIHNWYRWMSTINWINIANDDWAVAGWLDGWMVAAGGGVPSATHVFDTNKQLNDTCRCFTNIFTRIHYYRRKHTLFGIATESFLSIVHHRESAHAIVIVAGFAEFE